MEKVVDKYKKLDVNFYEQSDVVNIAKQLIGKVLCTSINNLFTSGIICETEAYAGEIDKASHAFGGRRTKRTETMYKSGGVSYIYLCYGMHPLFNVVTNIKDIPHAVLIRGIIPLEGKEIMLSRTKKIKIDKSFGIGPGKVSKALGMTCEHNNIDLTANLIWIEDRNIKVENNDIVATPRIGVAYAQEDALLPYRFVWDGK